MLGGGATPTPTSLAAHRVHGPDPPRGADRHAGRGREHRVPVRDHLRRRRIHRPRRAARRQRSLGPLVPPAVLVAGAVVLIGLERLFPGHALGYGFPNFLEMVHLEGGRVRRRWMIVKTLGAAISLGAGASVGREGPIAQIGGSIGSAVAQLLRSSLGPRQALRRLRRRRRHRNDLQRADRRRDVRPGDRPARRDRARAFQSARDLDGGRADHFARGARRRERLRGAAVRARELLGAPHLRRSWACSSALSPSATRACFTPRSRAQPVSARRPRRS